MSRARPSTKERTSSGRRSHRCSSIQRSRDTWSAEAGLSSGRPSPAPQETNEFPKRKWGPALLPAPTAPSEGSAGVRNLVPVTRRPQEPALDPGSPAQASLPIEPLPPCGGARLIYSTARPEGSLVFRPVRPAMETKVLKPKPSGQSRPMFCGPSWVNPSRVPLCSPHRNASNRVALEKIDSSGASSRLAPKRTRRLSPLPAGGDRTFGHLPLPSCPCGPSGEAGTAVPIT